MIGTIVESESEKVARLQMTNSENKTNSNYELKLRRDNAAAGDRTRVLQIRNMKREMTG